MTSATFYRPAEYKMLRRARCFDELIVHLFVSIVDHDILDFTPAFSASGAEPTLMNIIEGRKCILEIYVR